MKSIFKFCKSLVRKKKYKQIKTPALDANPQVKGVCIKVYTRAPKKPNSAIRKVAKVKTSTNKKIECYIPGEGHKLQQFSAVLVRGGRVPDLPGVKYHLVRGKHDFKGVENRVSARSKYGVKKKKIKKVKK